MAFWKGGRTLHHHGPMTRDEFKKLPRHVAIIMDGNGRWAKKHKLAVAKGHRQGVETLREIIRHTDDLKIEALSLYAFSTENWNRSPEEVGALMGLILEFFASEIDELDAKIHPVLLKYLIMMFGNMKKNKKGAQLIFTSHDLSTMNSEVFRRDEIWFVAKGKCQNSKLYSLVEFKNKKGESVRKDAKFDKQYLEGKYGADPYLKRIIDWGRVNG